MTGSSHAVHSRLGSRSGAHALTSTAGLMGGDADVESRGLQGSGLLLDRAARRWWLVALGMVAGAVLGVGLLSVLPKTYASTAAVLVTPVGQVAASSNGGAASRTAADLNLDTESQVAVSAEVAGAVKAILKTPDDIGTLQDAVAVTVPPNSSILSITYAGKTAEAAQNGAHAFAQAYLDNRAATAKKQVDATVAGLQAQLDGQQKQLLALTGSAAKLVARSPDQLYAGAEITIVTNQVNSLAAQLAAVRTAASTPGQIITDAVASSSPASPSPPLVVGGCLVLGLLLGGAAALLAARRDPRLRRGRDVPALTGLPLLGTVGTARRTGAVANTNRPFYDRLRNALLRAGGQPVTIQVCVDAPSPATAVVALDLAAAVARHSGSAVLLCAHPESRLPQLTDSVSRRGLTDVLRGQAVLEDVLLAVPALPGVSLVPPGTMPAELADLLQSPRLGEVLAGLRGSPSVVVETAGPDRSAGAQSISAGVDVVILVARASRSDAKVLRRDAAAAAQMGTQVAGVLLVTGRPRKKPAAPGAIEALPAPMPAHRR